MIFIFIKNKLNMDLLSVSDLSVEVLNHILRETREIKENPGDYRNSLKGKSAVVIFEKPSTRTRVSFEVGIFQLGGKAVILNADDMQLGRGETIKDSARILSRYVDGIIARVNEHKTLVELAGHSNVPVVNALSDLEHPCQAVSDLFTVREQFGGFDVKMAYVGDGNNVCNSLILGCAMVGVEMWIATPEGYGPDRGIVDKASGFSDKVKVMNDPLKAVRDADVVYTDTWVSMGSENEEEERLSVFKGYQVNKELLGYAKPGCRVMHCMPLHRDVEITSEVVDGPGSIILEQAENRLYAQKAILAQLL